MINFLKAIGSFRFLKHLLIAAIIVASSLLGLSIAFKIVTRHNETIMVPDLIKHNYKAATAHLKKVNLQPKLEFKYKPDVAENQVLEQYPKPKTLVKRNQTIYLTVSSKKAPRVKLPPVEGLSLYEAKTMLANEKISIAGIEYTADIQKDIVLKVIYNKEVLRANELIPIFSEVTLVLGNGFGKHKLQVPNLIGLNLQEVLFALRSSGLILGAVNNDAEDRTKNIEELKVYKQYPEADNGQELSQGDKIDIFLQ